MKKGDLVRPLSNQSWSALMEGHGTLWVVIGFGSTMDSYSVRTKSLATGFHFNWGRKELEVAEELT